MRTAQIIVSLVLIVAGLVVSLVSGDAGWVLPFAILGVLMLAAALGSRPRKPVRR